jgi:hypothetical protein
MARDLSATLAAMTPAKKHGNVTRTHGNATRAHRNVTTSAWECGGAGRMFVFSVAYSDGYTQVEKRI